MKVSRFYQHSYLQVTKFKRNKMKKYFCLFTLLSALCSFSYGYTITSFDPQVVFSGSNASQLASLDAAVGITGYTLENFEDNTLIDGLSVQFQNISNPSSSQISSVLRTNTPNNNWDGATNFGPNLVGGNEITFLYAPGAASFGVGIGDVESQVEVFVNGELLGILKDLPNYNRPIDNAKEVYIRIDQQSGDSAITEVRFQPLASNGGDVINFDRLALLDSTVPEPSSLALLGLSLLTIVFCKTGFSHTETKKG